LERDDGAQPNGGALTADDGVLQADDELHGRCYDGEQVVKRITLTVPGVGFSVIVR
jgi:hypothetical protein